VCNNIPTAKIDDVLKSTNLDKELANDITTYKIATELLKGIPEGISGGKTLKRKTNVKKCLIK